MLLEEWEIVDAAVKRVPEIMLSINHKNELVTPMKILLRQQLARRNLRAVGSGTSSSRHSRSDLSTSDEVDSNVSRPQSTLSKSVRCHVSLYRDLLFLTIAQHGRSNINKTQFDREYRRAYSVLKDDEELGPLLRDNDLPPSSRAVWCELTFSLFRDLEL